MPPVTTCTYEIARLPKAEILGIRSVPVRNRAEAGVTRRAAAFGGANIRSDCLGQTRLLRVFTQSDLVISADVQPNTFSVMFTVLNYVSCSDIAILAGRCCVSAELYDL